MIIQLVPTIPMSTPKGKGLAWFVIDYGEEHHLMFVVAIDETGELWTFPSTQLRADKNITMGRTLEKEKNMIPTAKGIDHEIIELKNRVDSLEDLIDDIYNMNSNRKEVPFKIYSVVEKCPEGQKISETFFFKIKDAESWMGKKKIQNKCSIGIDEVYVH